MGEDRADAEGEGSRGAGTGVGVLWATSGPVSLLTVCGVMKDGMVSRVGFHLDPVRTFTGQVLSVGVARGDCGVDKSFFVPD